VKYVAEIKEDKPVFKLLSTVFICLVLLLFFKWCLFFLPHFGTKIFGNNYQYKSVFKALALALPWYVSLSLISVLNGFGSLKRVFGPVLEMLSVTSFDSFNFAV
jgi:PST family polysaccharide transporter